MKQAIGAQGNRKDKVQAAQPNCSRTLNLNLVRAEKILKNPTSQ